MQALGGGASVWPFSSGPYAKFFGRPAAKFDTATYVSVYNAGTLPGIRNAPQQMTTDGQFAYVLASDDVAAGAPHIMTTAERVENAVLATGDRAADALHLPSLDAIQKTLTTLGKDAALVLVVGGVAWYLIQRQAGRVARHVLD